MLRTDIPYFAVGIETTVPDPYDSKWTWLLFAEYPEARKVFEVAHWADNVMSIKVVERCDGHIQIVRDTRVKMSRKLAQ